MKNYTKGLSNHTITASKISSNDNFSPITPELKIYSSFTNIIRRFSNIFSQSKLNENRNSILNSSKSSLLKGSSNNQFNDNNSLKSIAKTKTVEFLNIPNQDNNNDSEKFRFPSLRQPILEEKEDLFPEFIKDFDNEMILSSKLKNENIFEKLKNIITKEYEEEENFRLELDSEKLDDFKNIDMIQLYDIESEIQIKESNQQLFVYVEKKNPFELLHIYSDRFPFLNFRKKIIYFKRMISKICELITNHAIFEKIILLVVLFNCMTMIIEDPNPEKSNIFFERTNYFFLAIYTIEMILKILGMGLILAKNSYLRDWWNILDFTIVITTYIPIIFLNSSSKFSSLRILRIMRPLRAISSIKGLKIILFTLISSMPLLFDIFLIFLFFFYITAMSGTILFGGTFKNNCFTAETGILIAETLCGYGECGYGELCGKALDNPNYGLYNFDNLFTSFLLVFQCITLQAWTSVMFSAVKITGYWVEIYFVVIIIFGAFVLLNLTLAIIKTKFTDTMLAKKVESEKKINNKKNEINIEELKLFKITERNHFKRIKKNENIKFGASEEGRNINSRINEITWDDLLELKQRIKEEREIEDINDKFEKNRQENLGNFHDNHLQTENIFERIKRKSLGLLLNNKTKRASLAKKKKLSFNKVKMLDIEIHKPRFSNKISPENIPQISEFIKDDSPVIQKVDFVEKPKNLFQKSNKLNISTKNLLIQPFENTFQSIETITEQKLKVPKMLNNEFLTPNNNHIRPSITFIKKETIDNTNRKSIDNSDSSRPIISSAGTNSAMNGSSVILSAQRKSILKKNINFVNNSNVGKIQDFSINLVKFELNENQDKNKQIAKKYNVTHYKLMVDISKEYNSNSKADVLQNRLEFHRLKKISNDLKQIKETQLPIYHKLKKMITDPEIINWIRNHKIKSNEKKTYHLKRGSIVVDRIQHNKKVSLFLAHNFRGRTRSHSNNAVALNLKGKTSSNSKNKKNNMTGEDLEINFNNVKAKINEKIIEEKKENFEDYSNNYNEIQINDIETGSKSKYVWSGQDVLPFHIIEAIWTRTHVNHILFALSTQNHDFQIWLNGYKGKKTIFDKLIYNFTTNKQLETFFLFLVICHIIVICLPGLIDEHNPTLERINLIFIILFAIEMILKLYSFNFSGYIKDKMNIFDANIVILSFIEIIFSLNTTTMKIFRAFRVFRVFRFLRSLKFMKKIINVVKRSFVHIIYIALLLIICLFIYSLLAMQLFYGTTNDSFRENFNDYTDSIVTTFQILTAIMWQRILYIMTSENELVVPSIFLISWIIIGNFILLNLFLAILLEEFNRETRKIEENNKNEDSDFEEEYILKKINEVKMKEINANESPKSTAEQNNEIFGFVEVKNTFWMLLKIHNFSKACKRIINDNKFKNFILFIVFCSSLKLIIDTYLKNDSLLFSQAKIADYVLNIIFTLECLLKIVGLGFIWNKDSYLRSKTNLMDFIITLFSIIEMMSDQLEIPIFKFFSLLRVLRPLRFISHNINLKIVVMALLDSVSSIIHVISVIFLIWLVFAILGVSFLGGKLGYCAEIDDYYGINEQNCHNYGGEWKIRDSNFDNIINSMRTLLILSSRELWVDIMNHCADSNEPEIGPIKDNFYIIKAFFMLFILIGSYFSINLLVGVIFFHFSKAQNTEKTKNSLFLTPGQIKWLNIQKMVAKAVPDFSNIVQPKSTPILYIYKLINSKIYINFIMLIIFGNSILYATNYNGSSSLYKNNIEKISILFLSLFILDSILKIIVSKFKGFWVHSWNRFDLLLNTISIIRVILINCKIDGFNNGSFLERIISVIVIFRCLKLIIIFKKTHKMLQTLLLAFPSLINVGVLLILIFFIYSILGVFIFSNIKHGEAISEFVNFWNFGNAMITLFKVASGDDWYIIMYDLARNEKNCEKNHSCGTIFAFFYILSFFVLSAYIMINLFILIIIQQFEEFNTEENNPVETFHQNLDNFKKIWGEFAIESNGYYISNKNLIDFYIKLEPPLGFGSSGERAKIALEIMKMKLEGDDDGNIYFNDLLFASLKRVFGAEMMNNVSEQMHNLLAKEEKKIKKRIKKKKSHMFKKESFISSFLGEKSPNRARSNSPAKSNFSLHNSMKSPKKQTVNPIMAILFLGMAFKTWKTFSKKKLNNELLNNDSLQNISEEDFSDDVTPASSKNQENKNNSIKNSINIKPIVIINPVQEISDSSDSNDSDSEKESDSIIDEEDDEIRSDYLIELREKLNKKGRRQGVGDETKDFVQNFILQKMNSSDNNAHPSLFTNLFSRSSSVRSKLSRVSNCVFDINSAGEPLNHNN